MGWVAGWGVRHSGGPDLQSQIIKQNRIQECDYSTPGGLIWDIPGLGLQKSPEDLQTLSYATTTWMNLEGTVLSEVSQKENNKYLMISFICGILEKQKLIQEIDWWLSDAGDGGEGEMGKGQNTDFSVIRWVSYRMLTTVINIVSYTWKLQRE